MLQFCFSLILYDDEYWLSLAPDGQDGVGLQLEKIGQHEKFKGFVKKALLDSQSLVLVENPNLFTENSAYLL